MELTKLGINDVWILQAFITGIFIPFLFTLINSFFSRILKKINLPVEVKGIYKDFLIQHSRPVDDLFNKLSRYQMDTLIIIRIFSFLEGCLAGVFFFLILFQCFFYISQYSFFNDVPPFSLYYNYLNADNVITKNIYSLYLVSSFNIFSIFAIMFCGICLIIIDSRGYLFLKHKEDLSLVFWSKFIYHFYYFLIGLLVGINLPVFLFSIGTVANFYPTNQSFSFSLEYFIDTLGNLIVQVPSMYLVLVILCYVLGITLTIYEIYLFSMIIIGLSVVYKHRITTFYVDQLPHVQIKTECGDVSGQLKNVQNKSLIILNENDVIKAIPWNQIKVMEIKNKEVNSKLDMTISSETAENKKHWWKFW